MNYWEKIKRELVWKKGGVSPLWSPDVARYDYRGNLIFRQHYGDRNSPFGWEIDHIAPYSLDPSDLLSNLRPVQWRLNAARQPGSRLYRSEERSFWGPAVPTLTSPISSAPLPSERGRDFFEEMLKKLRIRHFLENPYGTEESLWKPWR
jgi:hypothetical protein